MINTEIVKYLKSAAGNLSLQPEERAAILMICKRLEKSEEEEGMNLMGCKTCEKSVSKKPLNVSTDRLMLMDLENKSVRKILVGDCPTCGKAIRSFDKFCGNCGQALNWGNEKAQKIVGASFPACDEVSNAKAEKEVNKNVS